MIACPHCKHEFEPLVLDGPQKRGRTMQTFAQWVESLNGEEAIPADHSSMRYAERVGIPHEFVLLAWEAFKRRYTGTQHKGKKYRDWRAHFQDSLEKNYARLWWVSDEGVFGLTQIGKQLKLDLQRRGQ